MQLNELLAQYGAHPTLQALAQACSTAQARLHLHGMAGSQEALLLAALAQTTDRPLLVVVNEREDAQYMLGDLQLLLPERTVLHLPASSRKPYQVEHIENANVVTRTETLFALNQARPGSTVIVTYPEALAERVLEQQTLLRSTFALRVGERPGMDLLLAMLDDYGFEQADFVYEAGQYAVRGGIVDIFAFNAELPWRVVFDGEEVESIRVFNPEDQLSVQRLTDISILPNLNTALLQERRVSLLDYISPRTIVAIRDAFFALDELEKVFLQASKIYGTYKPNEQNIALQRAPETLFVQGPEWQAQLERFVVIETGRRPFYKNSAAYGWHGRPQPLFKKEFSMLADHLLMNQQNGTRNLICCENEKQVKRLQEIFHQIAPKLQYETTLDTVAEGFLDGELNLALYTDHQIFERYHRWRGQQAYSKSQALTLKELLELRPGDFVTHVNHGIGRFAGLEKVQVGESWQEAVKIVYQDGDTIFVNVNALYKISKYAGKEGNVPKLNKIGSPEWARTKAKVKKRVKELAFDLVQLYAKRKMQTGTAYSADSYLQDELEASFMYEDTPDQEKATADVKRDMEAPHPMDRLVCGDVGFGKTEIAIRAAFKAMCEGKQVAVLVPTTILAMQHYNTFKERLGQFKPRMDYLNRFRSASEQKETLKKLAEGQVDVIIGTHRLLSKDVIFKDLGLLVIDEEHKFGVGHKEKIKNFKVTVDTLTLTATPIPRTLQFSLLGIRDLSIIATPPPNRKPVETIVTGFDAENIRDAIAYELKRKGQVFFIHNRIKDLEEYASMIKKLVPDARIGMGHGQLDGEKLEEIMLKFVNGEYDVLVSTTIVESGLDIPNANTIIINQAHTYGLSDLHQMRGRVGRSNRKAFCYLLAPPLSVLPTDARKRLQAIEEFSDLGSGIQIAMRDLDIRGAGDILGSEQSGFIAEVGYDFYHKVLDEAIMELKLELMPEEMAAMNPTQTTGIDCQVDTDLPVSIPDNYVPSMSERLNLYKRISEAADEQALQVLLHELQDRFGLVPAPTLALFDTVRLRWLGQQLGLEKINLKNGQLRASFVSDSSHAFFQSDAFGHLLEYIQQQSKNLWQLKQIKGQLILAIQHVKSIKEALFSLLPIVEALKAKVVS